MSRFKRVFLIVLDSFGIGEMPDADAFGDAGANTIRSVATSREFVVPNMAKLGLQVSSLRIRCPRIPTASPMR